MTYEESEMQFDQCDGRMDGWINRCLDGSLHGVLIRDPPVFTIFDATKFLLLITNAFARNLESTTSLNYYRMYVIHTYTVMIRTVNSIQSIKYSRG